MNPIRNKDITSLPADKLFASLKALGDNNARAKAGRQAKGKNGKKKRTVALVDKRPLLERTTWHDEAVVLLVDRITCQCCGNEIVAPNNKLLLRRRNKLVGTHLKAMGPGERYPDLPHVTEYIEQSVPACHLCFAIPEALYQQSLYQQECERQLCLPTD